MAELRPKTDRVVIHCAATRPSQDIGADWIDRIHRDERGFAQIGYHFVIRRNGVVELGRGIEEIGAHARGWNHRSVGVCLVGGVREDDGETPQANYTGAQWRALQVLVLDLLRRYPDATVVGHRDLPGVAKGCPCFDVAAWLLSGEPEGVVMPGPAPRPVIWDWQRVGVEAPATAEEVLRQARVLAHAVRMKDGASIRRWAAAIARTIERLDAQEAALVGEEEEATEPAGIA